jgi:hypothetical protein
VPRPAIAFRPSPVIAGESVTIDARGLRRQDHDIGLSGFDLTGDADFDARSEQHTAKWTFPEPGRHRFRVWTLQHRQYDELRDTFDETFEVDVRARATLLVPRTGQREIRVRASAFAGDKARRVRLRLVHRSGVVGRASASLTYQPRELMLPLTKAGRRIAHRPGEAPVRLQLRQGGKVVAQLGFTI